MALNLAEKQAIVTEVAGTTRDVLRERIDIDGLAVELVDTAGLRNDPDRIEAEGIRRARAVGRHGKREGTPCSRQAARRVSSPASRAHHFWPDPHSSPAMLLARLWDPSTGTIRLDGRDLRDFARSELPPTVS